MKRKFRRKVYDFKKLNDCLHELYKANSEIKVKCGEGKPVDFELNHGDQYIPSHLNKNSPEHTQLSQD